MANNARLMFGKSESTVSTNIQDRSSTVKGENSWKDYLYYFSIFILVAFTVSNVHLLLEDPEVRMERLTREATVERESQLAAEKIRAERVEALRIAALPPLKIHSFDCQIEYGFVTISGEVTNQSRKSLENLMAVGSFRKSDGKLVKSTSSMVTYQPLLVGQKSPFKVIVSHNPTIKNCQVSFKTMFGGEVAYEK